MKKVILDTNFILICVKEKIDFFEYFEMGGFKVLIPDKVLFELKRISLERKGGIRARAEFSLRFLESGKFEKIEVKGKYTDSAIVNYLKENPNVYLATIDGELKKKVRKNLFIIRSGNKIEAR